MVDEVNAEPALVKILLVDDEPKNLLALEAVLAGEGRTLRHASSGPEALMHLLREDFAVILLDVNMPGMDGITMVKALRADDTTRGIAVLMLTSEDSVEKEAQALEAGVDDYILKPVEPRRLAARVRSVLARSQRRQTAIPQ